MDCFEYNVISTSDESMISKLDEEGKKGWEVIQLLSKEHLQGWVFTFLLKREIDGE